MAELPTIKIRQASGHPAIINAGDYDPNTMSLWEDSHVQIEAEVEAHAEAQGETSPEETQVRELAILALINHAQHTYELEPIPTVGKAAAKAILDHRPEGGYLSLEDVGLILPARSCLEAIRQWTYDPSLNQP